MIKTLAFALALSISGMASASAAPLKAVASITIIADLVHQVGGDLVEVKSIVGPNGDAHSYEPKPQDSKTLSEAQIVFVNGLGLDPWIEKMTTSSGFKGPLVITTQGIKTHEFQEDGKKVVDPHAWQDLSNGQIYVANIAKALCAVDSKDCATFNANATAYSAKLAALDKDLKTRFAALPEASRQVVTTHDAFGYFAIAYGLHFLAPEGFATEAEPSAAAVAKLVRQIKHDKIKALFFENMSDNRVIEAIAKETGVRAGPPLYADALSKPGEPGATYLAMFKYNTDTLLKALSGN
jgi:zinc/manganese transport system substrate-binding protein